MQDRQEGLSLHVERATVVVSVREYPRLLREPIAGGSRHSVHFEFASGRERLTRSSRNY